CLMSYTSGRRVGEHENSRWLGATRDSTGRPLLYPVITLFGVCAVSRACCFVDPHSRAVHPLKSARAHETGGACIAPVGIPFLKHLLVVETDLLSVDGANEVIRVKAGAIVDTPKFRNTVGASLAAQARDVGL